MRRVNAWKNITNREIRTVDDQSLTEPDEPKRKRKINPYLSSTAPTPFDPIPKRVKSKDDLDIRTRDDLRSSIHQHMLALLAERNGRLGNRKEVAHELITGLGLTLERTAKTSITVTHEALTDKNGKPQRIRLEGGIYHKDFDAKDFKSEAQTEYKTNHVRRRLRDDETYKVAMQIKAEQNKELYKDAVAPPKLDIAINPVITSQTPQKGTETLPVTDSAPKRPIQRP